MQRKYLVIILSGLTIVICAGLLMFALFSLKPEPPQKPIEEIVPYVKTELVSYSDMEAGFTASGRVMSEEEVALAAEVSGKILPGKISFKKGETFKKGDLLVKIYDEETKLALKAKKSKFLNSLAGVLPDFKIDFKDQYTKWYEFFENIDIDKDLPELPEVKSGKEKVFLASRNLLADYFGIKSDELRLKKHSIYAPFDGTIVEANLEVGAIAAPGVKLGKIINTRELELEVPVEHVFARWIKDNQKVIVKSDNGTRKYSGKVVRIGDNLDLATQSVPVFISVKSGKEDKILKGEYLTAEFSGVKLNAVMKIPRSAVFNNNEVFVVDKNETLSKEEINILLIGQKEIYFNGVTANEKVVIEPLINATENTKVRTEK